MEVLFLMHQKDNPEEQKEFEKFLEVYLKNQKIRQWWNTNRSSRLAFGKEFRDVVNGIINPQEKASRSSWWPFP